jgi:hypothetical protein
MVVTKRKNKRKWEEIEVKKNKMYGIEVKVQYLTGAIKKR